ncbi:hypothetical protein Tco_0468160 [Tanacetum coccineum]
MPLLSFLLMFCPASKVIVRAEIIAHSIGDPAYFVMLQFLLQLGTLTFRVPEMYGTDILILGPLIILLCWDGDLITMKFIYAEVECSSSLIFTSKDIWPSGQMVSPLNPVRCFRIDPDEAPHPRTFGAMKCPPIQPQDHWSFHSVLVSQGGKDIVVSGEKTLETLCLATLSHVGSSEC